MGATRQNQQREWKLLSWWLAQNHSHAEHIWMQARVGPSGTIPNLKYTPEIEAMARVRNRWADAVYIEDGAISLVEAKMKPDPGVFSILIHYARNLRRDPYFSQFNNLPLHLIALMAQDDPSLAEEAPWYGVQWVVYHPPWLGLEEGMASGRVAFGIPGAAARVSRSRGPAENRPGIMSVHRRR